MIVSQVYDKLKQYIDLKLSNAETALTTLFQTYKTKEVGSNINAVKTVNDNIDLINLVSDSLGNVQILKNYYNSGTITPDGSGGQLLGNQLIKSIQYMSNSYSGDITIQSGTSAFAIDHLESKNGAILTIEDGAIFKIL